MKYLLAFLTVISTAQAVDFSQADKQSHALLGCAASSMARGFATDGENDHPALWGLGAGIASGIAYEALISGPKDMQEHKQDALAAGIGAVMCIGVAEGVSLTLNKNTVSVGSHF